MKKKYVLIRLKGGLGNQLFQYYTAYNLSKSKGYDLILDISDLEKDNLRKFELRNLDINLKIIKSKWERIYFILLKSLLSLNSPYFHKEKEEFSYDKEIKEIKKSLILNGYYQNETYFTDISISIREDFKNNSKEIKDLDIFNEIQKTLSVALHIRRGDYINSISTNNIHGACDIKYYHEAIKKFSHLNPVYFVFSDDIEWCKRNLKIENRVYYVSENAYSDYIEFLLMQNCKHFIISNSTFSWWAAWLSSNDQKIIISPNNWFKNKKLNNLSKSLIPNNWIKI